MADSRQFTEKRNFERVHVSVPAEVSLGGESVECAMIDISTGGAKVRFKSDPFKKIVLSVPPFGEIEGEIVWKDDEYVGIKFHDNHDRIAEIIDTVVATARR